MTKMDNDLEIYDHNNLIYFISQFLMLHGFDLYNISFIFLTFIPLYSCNNNFNIAFTFQGRQVNKLDFYSMNNLNETKGQHRLH